MEACRDKIVELLAKEAVECVVRDDTILFVYRNNIQHSIKVIFSKPTFRPGVGNATLNIISDTPDGWHRSDDTTSRWLGNNFEKAAHKIVEYVVATKELEVGKSLMIKLFSDQNIQARMEGDSIILPDNTIIRFRIDAIWSKPRGEILGNHTCSTWILGQDCEFAVCDIIDSVLGTNLLHQAALQKVPSFQNELGDCQSSIMTMLKERGIVCTTAPSIKPWQKTVFCPSGLINVDIELCSDRIGGVVKINDKCSGRWTIGYKAGSEWAACRTVDTLLGTNLVEEYERKLYGLIPKEQADKAAKWWADQLRGKSPRLNPLQIELVTGGLMSILQSTLQAQSDASSRADRFEILLAVMLQNTIAEPRGVYLSVDYNSCGKLYKCWERSDPDSKDDGFGHFPCKTRMRIYKDKILLGSTLSKEENDKPL